MTPPIRRLRLGRTYSTFSSTLFTILFFLYFLIFNFFTTFSTSPTSWLILLLLFSYASCVFHYFCGFLIVDSSSSPPLRLLRLPLLLWASGTLMSRNYYYFVGIIIKKKKHIVNSRYCQTRIIHYWLKLNTKTLWVQKVQKCIYADLFDSFSFLPLLLLILFFFSLLALSSIALSPCFSRNLFTNFRVSSLLPVICCFLSRQW